MDGRRRRRHPLARWKGRRSGNETSGDAGARHAIMISRRARCMRTIPRQAVTCVICLLAVIAAARSRAAEAAVELPGGVKAVWDLSDASREATPTRERVCIN